MRLLRRLVASGRVSMSEVHDTTTMQMVQIRPSCVIANFIPDV
jgi:hypothetical protein